MGLNVFKDYRCYSRYWMITHPWLYFKHGYYNLKAAWQRTIRGYADRDVFNLDMYLLELLPATLKQLAKTAHGHPINFEYEAWIEFLNKLAADFEKCQDDEGNDENEYYDEYVKSLDTMRYEEGRIVFDDDEISKLYFDRMKETSKERQKLLEDCFARTAACFYGLWD